MFKRVGNLRKGPKTKQKRKGIETMCRISQGEYREKNGKIRFSRGKPGLLQRKEGRVVTNWEEGTRKANRTEAWGHQKMCGGRFRRRGKTRMESTSHSSAMGRGIVGDGANDDKSPVRSQVAMGAEKLNTRNERGSGKEEIRNSTGEHRGTVSPCQLGDYRRTRKTAKSFTTRLLAGTRIWGRRKKKKPGLKRHKTSRRRKCWGY